VLSEGRLAVGQFYGRRAWRILPAYWVALAIATALAMAPATWSLVVAEPATWFDAVVHTIGMQTWVPSTLGTINGSLWSVSLEIQLYIVFPVLILAWRWKGIVPLLIASALLALVWSQLGPLQIGAPLGTHLGDGHALPARLLQFVIGMACAQWVLTRPVPSARFTVTATVMAVVLGCTGYTLGWNTAIMAAIWGLVGAGLILSLNGMGREGSVLSPPEWFGARSYSFYLLHQPALLLSAPLVALIPGGWIPQFVLGGALCFAATTAAAALLFRTVERPSHRLGRRFFPRPTPRALSRRESAA